MWKFHPTSPVGPLSPMAAKGTEVISSGVEMYVANILFDSQAFHLPAKWKRLG